MLERVAADDRDAFTSIYTVLYPRLFRYLLVVTRSESLSEELLQEVFVKLWMKRQTLIGITSLEHYVFRMVKNQWISHQRKEGRLVNISSGSGLEKAAQDNVFEEIVYKEYHQLAQEAIAALPPRRRLIFLLNAQGDLTGREIAEKLNLSLSTVKKQLFEANHFVRDYLRAHGESLLLVLCNCLIFL